MRSTPPVMQRPWLHFVLTAMGEGAARARQQRQIPGAVKRAMDVTYAALWGGQVPSDLIRVLFSLIQGQQASDSISLNSRLSIENISSFGNWASMIV